MSAPILARVCNTENLPSLPTVALDVLRLTQDETATIPEIARVIQHDPALTARLLRLVNSSRYGMARQVTSLQQAMNLLGLRTVRVMTLSFSLVGVMEAPEGRGFDHREFWRRSITTAAAARLLADVVAPARADEAFVAGLLAHIGRLAAARTAPDLYQPVLDAAAKAPGRSLHEIEREVLKCSHAAMGRALLAGWGLPDPLVDAVGSHLGEGIDGLPDASASLARVVRAAAAIADVFCGGAPGGAAIAEVHRECCGALGLEPAEVETALRALDGEVRESAEALSIPIGQTIDYAQLQSDAVATLARLSVEAESERSQTALQAETARREADRLRDEKRAILELASTDGLTGVATRAEFDKRLDEEVRRARAARRPLALIMIDLDNFKRLNDQHGHRAGDAALRLVGAILRDFVAGAGFAARYGGEEFAVIISSCADAEEATLAAGRLGAIIASRVVEHEDKRFTMTVSQGVAFAPADAPGLSAESMVDAADQRLYHAKNTGRNRVESVVIGAAAPRQVRRSA